MINLITEPPRCYYYACVLQERGDVPSVMAGQKDAEIISITGDQGNEQRYESNGRPGIQGPSS